MEPDNDPDALVMASTRTKGAPLALVTTYWAVLILNAIAVGGLDPGALRGISCFFVIESALLIVRDWIVRREDLR